MGRRSPSKGTGNAPTSSEDAYERVLRRYKHHPLIAFQDSVDWDAIVAELLPPPVGLAMSGHSAHARTVLLKMLFLSYLYKIPDPSLEEFVDLDLPARWFVGLSLHERTPDMTTFSAFRQRLGTGPARARWEAVFDALILTARERGLAFGEYRIVDSERGGADDAQAHGVRSDEQDLP